MKNKLNYAIKAKERVHVLDGYLKIETSGSDGIRRVYYEGRNVITLPSKQQVLSGVYLEEVVSDPVIKLWVGTGGSVDSLGLFPKGVDEMMTNLFSPLVSVPTTYLPNLAVPSVTFLADLDQGQGNGQIINEAGLFKVSETMFNIKTFPGISKSSDFNIHFAWTIQMA